MGFNGTASIAGISSPYFSFHLAGESGSMTIFSPTPELPLITAPLIGYILVTGIIYYPWHS
jgi:hypothetical protein